MHLLAAGAWLGGLLPLFIAVGMLPREDAAVACRSFTPIGLAAVLLLAGTAVVQVTALMGGLPGLLGTEYGHVALIKLALFLVLLVLAGLNRFVFTEHLAAGSPACSPPPLTCVHSDRDGSGRCGDHHRGLPWLP